MEDGVPTPGTPLCRHAGRRCTLAVPLALGVAVLGALAVVLATGPGFLPVVLPHRRDGAVSWHAGRRVVSGVPLSRWDPQT